MSFSKKILFICPYPVGESPSQRFRFEQYIQLLKDKGFSATIRPFWDNATWTILYSAGNSRKKVLGILKGFIKRFFDVFLYIRQDFIFIHRESTPVGPPVIEFIISKILRKKIIYDFDDAIWIPNTSVENRIASGLKWHSKFNSICRWSYLLSCGNSWLYDYGSQFNSNAAFNPTTLDTERLHNPALYTKLKKDKLIIGWTGTHSTLKSLAPLLPVMEQLNAEFPNKLEFCVIADKDPKIANHFFRFIPWSKQTEIQDLMTFDIGVMPLPDDVWSKGKCGFKALQYMALEIPAVVSAVGVNTEIIKHRQNGFIAASENDWIEIIRELIQHNELRKQAGQAGRKTVEEYYSVTSNSSAFLALFA